MSRQLQMLQNLLYTDLIQLSQERERLLVTHSVYLSAARLPE